MSPLARLSLPTVVAVLMAASCAQRVTKDASPPAASEAPSSTGSEGPTQPGYGAAPPSQQPGYGAPSTTSVATPRDEEQFSSVEDAEAALARALEELGGEVAEKKKTAPTGGAGAAPSPHPAATTQPAPLDAADPRCVNACRAFASLKRAANAVCRLAGDSDARCSRARAIVKDSEPRVKACSCGDGDP